MHNVKATGVDFKNISYGASHILQQMLRDHLCKDFAIARHEAIDVFGPQHYCIGICIPAVFGSEVLGVISNRLKAEGSHLDVCVIYFLPFEGHVYLSGNDLLIQEGCYITSEGVIQPIKFSKPLVVDRVIFEGYKDLGENHTNDEIYELTRDKNQSYYFLKREKILTTDNQLLVTSDSDLTDSIRFISENYSHPIVVKPFDGSNGLGVKMFEPKDGIEAVIYCRNLLNLGEKLVIERRINSYPLYEGGKRLDWNIRFMVYFDCNKEPLVDKEMTYVRVQFFGSTPVNVHHALRVEKLQTFVNALKLKGGEETILLRDLEVLMKRLGRAFINTITLTGIHEIPTFLGVDLIFDEAKNWRVIELNSGNVGDLPLILRSNNFDLKILDPVLHGMIRAKKSVNAFPSNVVGIKLDNLRTYYFGDLGSVLEKFETQEARKAYSLL